MPYDGRLAGRATYDCHATGDRDDHHATERELADQLVGQSAGLRGHQDPVERGPVRKAEHIGGGVADAGPRHRVLRQVLAPPGHEFRHALHGMHLAGGADQDPEQRSGPAGSGSDVEDPVARFDLEKCEHVRHRGRLAVGLPVADVQCAVLVGVASLVARQEVVATDGVEGLSHAFVKHALLGAHPNRATARAFAFAASTSRSFGGAVVVRSSSRRWVTSATSSTARSKASWLACEGLVVPLTLRTYWTAAAYTSACVAAGSKLCRVRMLRHMYREYSADRHQFHAATGHDCQSPVIEWQGAHGAAVPARDPIGQALGQRAILAHLEDREPGPTPAVVLQWADRYAPLGQVGEGPGVPGDRKFDVRVEAERVQPLGVAQFTDVEHRD